MLKKIIIIFILLAITAATVIYFIGMDKTESVLEENQSDTTPLTEEESQAIQLLNDEMIYDQCVIYADDQNVKDEELKEYLASCVEELKAEATMIESVEDEKNQKEILKQCGIFAEQDKIIKEKLDEYMDLCIEQLRSEATMIEPEEAEVSKGQTAQKVDDKPSDDTADADAVDKKSPDDSTKKTSGTE